MQPVAPATSAEPLAEFRTVHLDFESGTLDGWTITRLVGDHSAVIQGEHVRVGTLACRFELRPGDYISQGHRAELRDPLNAPFDVPIWYGFSTLIPDDFPVAEAVPCVLAQWHDQAKLGDPSGKPPIAVRYRGGDLFVTGAYGRFASPDPDQRYEFAVIPDFPRGAWQDFVFRVVWSRHGTSTISAWLNRARFLAWSGRLGYENEAEGPYFKLGVYCSGPIRTSHAAFHDNYSHGHSFEEVDPSVLHGRATGTDG